jgi:ribosomal protein S25
MTFQTRIIARRGSTYMQPGHDGVHVNKITLRAEPWTVAEPEAEHPRPAAGKFEAISVRTPQVPKVRVPCPDTFAANDEDFLRKAWIAGIRPDAKRLEVRSHQQRCTQEAYDAVAKHLRASPDTRHGIMQATRISESTVDYALRQLREEGNVEGQWGGPGNRCKIYAWVSAEGNAQPTHTATAPHRACPNLKRHAPLGSAFNASMTWHGGTTSFSATDAAPWMKSGRPGTDALQTL